MIMTYIPRARILLVEDLASTRKIVRSALEETEFAEVVEAVDAVKGLERLNEEKFDLVICDYNMGADLPTGIDLYDSMQGNDELKSISFILLTNQTDISLMDKARKRGISEFMPKPVKEDALVNKVIHLLRAMRHPAFKTLRIPGAASFMN